MTNVSETIWMPIPEFENLYEVSNFGIVRSLQREKFSGSNNAIYLTNEKILRPSLDKDCYFKLTLVKNGEFFYKRVHVLTATSFLENPLGLPIVAHKNGVRWDNRVENLEWSTAADNVQSGFNFGRKINSAKKILNTVTGSIKNIRESADESGYSRRYLSQMLDGTYNNKTVYVYASE